MKNSETMTLTNELSEKIYNKEVFRIGKTSLKTKKESKKLLLLKVSVALIAILQIALIWLYPIQSILFELILAIAFIVFYVLPVLKMDFKFVRDLDEEDQLR